MVEGTARAHAAYHEAGHAVVAVLAGIQIDWVAIAPAQGLEAGGQMRVLDLPRSSTQSDLIPRLAVFFAGLAGETFSPHLAGLRGEEWDRRDDLQAAQEYLAACCPDATPEEQQHLLELARDSATRCLAVRGHDQAVHAVASALVARHQLSHQDVAGLLAQAHTQVAHIRRWWRRGERERS